MRAVGLLFAISLSSLLLSCSSGVTSDNGKAGGPGAGEVRYSLVYVIHGDGGYTFHDSNGVLHRADEEALSGALLVGERSADAEVFIFYQKPQTGFLFFGRDDGQFWYFRQGKTLAADSYARDEPDLHAELRLFRHFSAGGERTFFLYYGHEVPEAGGESYDESGTGRAFNVASLSRALKGFSRAAASPSHTIDLLVLSTCFNGSPCTISRLAPYVQYIIASPEYLHLSYMQNALFRSLDTLNGLTTAEIANRFACLSFERLKKETETAITVVVYDTRKTAPFLSGTTVQCDSLVRTLDVGNEPAILRYFDWLDDPALYRKGAEQGVTVFYQPPEFGRLRTKHQHSGWEAWKVEEQRPEVRSQGSEN